MKGKLLLFNLELDLDSKVLAASHDWVESFSKLYSEVIVFSTYVGKVSLPSNVSIIEVGGGTICKRIVAIARLLSSIKIIWKEKNSYVALHHMSTYSAAILGPIFKVMGVRQGLWYSHSVKSASLAFSAKFVDFVYSSTQETLPYVSKKTRFFGHGIKVSRFESNPATHEEREGIVSIGRYARIKNFESLLKVGSIAPDIRVDVYGPDGDNQYKTALSEQIPSSQTRMSLHGPVFYDEIPMLLAGYDLFFSGTPKSVDKAAIEGALAGCFVVSQNSATIQVTGMNEVWQAMGRKIPATLEEQFRILLELDSNKQEFREILRVAAARKNDIEKLALAISGTLATPRKENGANS